MQILMQQIYSKSYFLWLVKAKLSVTVKIWQEQLSSLSLMAPIHQDR